MDLASILDGLESASPQERKESLEQLRSIVVSENEMMSLDVRNNKARLFRTLTLLLTDTNWNISLQCLQFLVDFLPVSGEEFDGRSISVLLPTLIHNLGDNKVAIRKAAGQVLSVLLQTCPDSGEVIKALVQNGLKSTDARVRLESTLQLPLLLSQRPNGIDYRDVVVPLVDLLMDRLDSVVQASVQALAHIRPLVGDGYSAIIKRLGATQKEAYQQYSNQIINAGVASGGGLQFGDCNNYINSNNYYVNNKNTSNNDGSTGSTSSMSIQQQQQQQKTLGLGGFEVSGKHLSVRANDNNNNNNNNGSTSSSSSSSSSSISFGFVPNRLLVDLSNLDDWRVRSSAIAELQLLVQSQKTFAPIASEVPKFVDFLSGLLQNANFKIELTTLEIIAELIGKPGINLKPIQERLMPGLIAKLGDNMIVVRQANIKVIMKMMQLISPRLLTEQLLTMLDDKNWRVREEIVGLVIHALLTFPSNQFDFALLASALQGCLIDSKMKVKLMAIECLAVVHNIIGSRLLMMLSNLDERIHKVLTDRFLQNQLPFLNAEGHVELPYLTLTSSSSSSSSNDTVAQMPQGDEVFRRQLSAGRSASRKIPFLNGITATNGGKSNTAAATTSNNNNNNNNNSHDEEITPRIDGDTIPTPTSQLSGGSNVNLSDGSWADNGGSQNRNLMRRNSNREDQIGSLLVENPSEMDLPSMRSHQHRRHQIMAPVPVNVSLLDSLESIPAQPSSTSSASSSATATTFTTPSKPTWFSESLGPSPMESNQQQSVPSARRLGSARRGRREGLQQPLPLENLSCTSDANNDYGAISSPEGTCDWMSNNNNNNYGNDFDRDTINNNNNYGSNVKPQAGRRARHLGEDGGGGGGGNTSSADSLCTNTYGNNNRGGGNLLDQFGRADPMQHSGPAWLEGERDNDIMGLSPLSASASPTNPFIQRSSSVNSSDIADKLRSLKSKKISKLDKHSRVMSACAALEGSQTTASLQADIDARAGTAHDIRRPQDGPEFNPFRSMKETSSGASLDIDSPTNMNMNIIGNNNSNNNSNNSSNSNNGIGNRTSRPAAKSVLTLTVNNAKEIVSPNKRKTAMQISSAPVELSSVDSLRPLDRPDNEVRVGMEKMQSADWQQQLEGLDIVRSLAMFHPQTLTAQLHSVMRVLLTVVESLRSGLSKAAIVTLNDLFTHLKNGLDSELEPICLLLIKKAADISQSFIADEAKKTLNTMTETVTEIRALSALLQCDKLRASPQRAKLAIFLDRMIEVMGLRLRNVGSPLVERLLGTLAALLGEGASETRTLAKKAVMNVYVIFRETSEFDRMMKKLSDADSARIKECVEKQSRSTFSGTMSISAGGYTIQGRTAYSDPSDSASTSSNLTTTSTLSASSAFLNRSKKPLIDSKKPTRTNSNNSSSSSNNNNNNNNAGGPISVQGTTAAAVDIEPLTVILTDLASSDFRTRCEGMNQLGNFMLTTDKNVVSTKIAPIIEQITSLCGDNNAKAALSSLQTLQRVFPVYKTELDSYSAMIITAVSGALASTNPTVKTLASDVFSDIVTQGDPVSLLQPLVSTSEYGNPRSKAAVLDKLKVVIKPAFARRPQLVTKQVLPLAFRLVDERKSDIKQANASIMAELYSVMGSTLLTSAQKSSDVLAGKVRELIAAAESS